MRFPTALTVQRMNTTASIAVAADSPQCQQQATRLAQQLGLPLTAASDQNYALLLVQSADRLELRHTSQTAPGPIFVDFLAGRSAHRYRFGGGIKQAIAKAVGLKSGQRPYVLDATAGLGEDAFVLASLGCQVQMLERSTIIAALLQDGLARAAADPDFSSWINQRLHLHVADARQFMQTINPAQRPDVVYLDPMYPERGKSNALVKKQMRTLRAVVGEDEDAADLLTLALVCAKRRVVVKRPRLGLALPGPEADFCLRAKSTRFDVYLIN